MRRTLTGGQKFSITREKADRSVCGGFAGMVCVSMDARGKATTFTYNSSGDLVTATPPTPLKPTTYTYDTASRPLTVTDPKGVVVTYHYDAADKLIYTSQLSEDGTATKKMSYLLTDIEASTPYLAQDEDYPSIPGPGASEMQNTTTFLFGDPRGDSLFRDQTPSGISKIATPDVSGNLKSFNGSYTNGASELLSQYGHDAANQLTNAGSAATLACTAAAPAPAGTDCVAYAYNAAGSVITQAFPGGAKKTTTYDAAQRPSRITVKDSANTVIYDVGYSFKSTGGKDRGLLQSKTSYKEEGIPTGAVTTYTYDSKKQLSTVTEKNGAATNASWVYEYDSSGNRCRITNSGATGTTNGTVFYDVNDANQITSSSTNQSGWAYDDAGNMTKDPDNKLEFTYNTKGGTKSIAKNGIATTYQYYGPGNTNRAKNGDTYEYQTQSGPEVTKNAAGTNLTSYQRDPQGNLLSTRTGSTRSYFVTDVLGSVVLLLDSSGKKVGGYSYDPYGNARTITGTPAQTNPIRYISGTYDQATGLYKLGARYYNPILGRFTQQDPSGQEQNPYTYAANNPIVQSDPSGLTTGGVSFGFCAIICANLGLSQDDTGQYAITGDVGLGAELGGILSASFSPDNLPSSSGADLNGSCQALWVGYSRPFFNGSSAGTYNITAPGEVGCSVTVGGTWLL